MKRFENGKDKLFVGNCREIRSLYNNMIKRGYVAVFSDAPIIRSGRFYGLTYSGKADCLDDGIVIVSEETAQRIIKSFIGGVI